MDNTCHDTNQSSLFRFKEPKPISNLSSFAFGSSGRETQKPPKGNNDGNSNSTKRKTSLVLRVEPIESNRPKNQEEYLRMCGVLKDDGKINSDYMKHCWDDFELLKEFKDHGPTVRFVEETMRRKTAWLSTKLEPERIESELPGGFCTVLTTSPSYLVGSVFAYNERNERKLKKSLVLAKIRCKRIEGKGTSEEERKKRDDLVLKYRVRIVPPSQIESKLNDLVERKAILLTTMEKDEAILERKQTMLSHHFKEGRKEEVVSKLKLELNRLKRDYDKMRDYLKDTVEEIEALVRIGKNDDERPSAEAEKGNGVEDSAERKNGTFEEPREILCHGSCLHSTMRTSKRLFVFQDEELEETFRSSPKNLFFVSEETVNLYYEIIETCGKDFEDTYERDGRPKSTSTGWYKGELVVAKVDRTRKSKESSKVEYVTLKGFPSMVEHDSKCFILDDKILFFLDRCKKQGKGHGTLHVWDMESLLENGRKKTYECDRSLLLAINRMAHEIDDVVASRNWCVLFSHVSSRAFVLKLKTFAIEGRSTNGIHHDLTVKGEVETSLSLCTSLTFGEDEPDVLYVGTANGFVHLLRLGGTEGGKKSSFNIKIEWIGSFSVTKSFVPILSIQKRKSRLLCSDKDGLYLLHLSKAFDSAPNKRLLEMKLGRTISFRLYANLLIVHRTDNKLLLLDTSNGKMEAAYDLVEKESRTDRRSLGQRLPLTTATSYSSIRFDDGERLFVLSRDLNVMFVTISTPKLTEIQNGDKHHNNKEQIDE